MAINYFTETYVVTDPLGSCLSLQNDNATLFYCQAVDWPSFTAQLHGASQTHRKIDVLELIQPRALITERIIRERTASKFPHRVLAKP